MTTEFHMYCSIEQDEYCRKVLLDLGHRFDNETRFTNVADMIEFTTTTIPTLMRKMHSLYDCSSTKLISMIFTRLWKCSQQAPGGFPANNLSLMALVLCMRRASLILCSDTSETDLFDHCVLRVDDEPSIDLLKVARLSHDHPDRFFTLLSNNLMAIVCEAVGARRGSLAEKLCEMYEAIHQYTLYTHHSAASSQVPARLVITISVCMLSLARIFWFTKQSRTFVLLENSRCAQLQAVLNSAVIPAEIGQMLETVHKLAKIERALSEILLCSRSDTVPDIGQIHHVFLELAKTTIVQGGNVDTQVVFNRAQVSLLPKMQSFMLLDGIFQRIFALVGQKAPVTLRFSFVEDDEIDQGPLSLWHRQQAEHLRIRADKDPSLFEEAKKASLIALKHHHTSVKDQKYPNTTRPDNEFNEYTVPPAICALMINAECAHRNKTLTDDEIVKILNRIAVLLLSRPLLPPGISPLFGANIDLAITARQISLLMCRLSPQKMDTLPSFKTLQKWLERVQVLCSPFPANSLFEALAYSFQ